MRLHLSLNYQIPFLYSCTPCSCVLSELQNSRHIFSVLPLYFTWIVIYDKACLCLHNVHDTCLRVCKGGGGGEEWGVFVRLSCVCVWASVYVCICHSRDCKKRFVASKDKNKVLKS